MDLKGKELKGLNGIRGKGIGVSI